MVAYPLGLVASIARPPLNEAWYLPEYSHDRAQGGFPHLAPSPHRLNRHVLRAPIRRTRRVPRYN